MQVIKINECCINLIDVVIVLNILLIIIVLTTFEVILRPVILLQIKYITFDKSIMFLSPNHNVPQILDLMLFMLFICLLLIIGF